MNAQEIFSRRRPIQERSAKLCPQVQILMRTRAPLKKFDGHDDHLLFRNSDRKIVNMQMGCDMKKQKMKPNLFVISLDQVFFVVKE